MAGTLRIYTLALWLLPLGAAAKGPGVIPAASIPTTRPSIADSIYLLVTGLGLVIVGRRLR